MKASTTHECHKRSRRPIEDDSLSLSLAPCFSKVHPLLTRCSLQARQDVIKEQ